MMDRVLAVDWSGAQDKAERKIWLCEVSGGEVRRLEQGRSREQLGAHLIDEAERDPGFVVGLDFAFSFPAHFLRKRAHHDVTTVWREAERLGERWLKHCPFPFWGKPGRKKPAMGEVLFRATELAVARETGYPPMSVFQIGGAGTVGVGSIRGMPMLRRLREAGFSIWPFDPPAWPRVVEIWPRLFVGSVSKSKKEARRRFLERRYLGLDPQVRTAAEGSDDAFDALVSGMEMYRDFEELVELAQTRDATTLLEGEIWRPLAPSPVAQPAEAIE
jgi:hypothetical protein